MTFSVTLSDIHVFEWKNKMIVNVLGIEEGKEKLYILRNAKFNGQRKANLLLIDQERKKHYATIKNMSRSLRVAIVLMGTDSTFPELFTRISQRGIQGQTL